eukprot:8626712-Alexandrium_andersonii.AAC.1
MLAKRVGAEVRLIPPADIGIIDLADEQCGPEPVVLEGARELETVGHLAGAPDVVPPLRAVHGWVAGRDPVVRVVALGK